MVWFFLGISIAADKFMEAISVITSKTKRIVIAGEEIEVTVWNETVANLTLMALGSSAPEILLATIETVALGFEAGELGPGTIVGSAAFNLLVITSICVYFVP
jgi:solute carrier family 8 (sodium/calcium exchanger)